LTLEFVRRWFNKLPNAEKDLPLLVWEGYAYTPRQALTEVEKNTPIGRALQSLVESGRFGTSSEEERELAKIRLKKVFEAMPEKPLFATLSGKTFTPKQLIEEIERNSEIGEQWILAETSRMRRLLK
jgi:hypothetical protein